MIDFGSLDEAELARIRAALRALPADTRIGAVDWAIVVAALRSGLVPPYDAENATAADVLAELDQLDAQRAIETEQLRLALVKELNNKLEGIFIRLVDDPVTYRRAQHEAWNRLSPRERRRRVQEVKDGFAEIFADCERRTAEYVRQVAAREPSP